MRALLENAFKWSATLPQKATRRPSPLNDLSSPAEKGMTSSEEDLSLLLDEQDASTVKSYGGPQVSHLRPGPRVIFAGLCLLSILVFLWSFFFSSDLRQQLKHIALQRETAWFDRVFAINLERRTDRRTQLEDISQALDIDIKIKKAYSTDDGIVHWIKQRVVHDHIDSGRHIIVRLRDTDVSNVTVRDWEGMDWKTRLDEAVANGEDLQPETRFDWSNISWDAQTDPEIACSLSHYAIWAQTVREGYKTVLVLEDDVDLEFELRSRWQDIERKLPKTWDAVYLGYCYSSEEIHGNVKFHPLIHQAVEPWCAHAIAYSQKGAKRLVESARAGEEFWIDTVDAYLRYIMKLPSNKLETYVIHPPLAIQDKDGVSNSNIDEPTLERPRWRGLLRDSVLDRIRQMRGTYKKTSKADIESDMAIQLLSY